MKSDAQNIWDVLSFYDMTLTREDTHLVQHVKWFNEVPPAKKKYPMCGSEKKDGNNGLFLVVDGECYLFSRKGKRYQNSSHIELKYENYNLRDGVYLTEVCNELVPRAEMNGWIAVNRVEPLSLEQSVQNEMTDLWFFDVLTLPAFMKGGTKATIIQRASTLISRNVPQSRIVEQVILNSAAEVKEFCDYIITKKEGEGGVISHIGDYLCGHKGFRAMKIVKVKSFDMTLKAVESGKGKNTGQASTFIFEDANGDLIKAGAGKGWDDVKCKDALISPEKYLNKIYEVYSMELLESGKLRQPKIGELRDDKIGVDEYGQAGNSAEE